MKALALLAIRGYQRWLSPRKGFSCAYRCWCGRAGCSTLGLRAIRRFGVWRGLQVLDGRLQQCRRAHEAIATARWRPRSQAGDCDCGGCDGPCDLPGERCDGCSACDFCDACDVCDCDWRRKDKARRDGKRKGRERSLPPRYPPTSPAT